MNLNAYFYRNNFEMGFKQLDVHYPVFDTSTLLQYSRTHFLDRPLGFSHHNPNSISLDHHREFIAVWDKKLVKGPDGIMLSPVLIFARHKHSHIARDLTYSDEHDIIDIVKQYVRQIPSPQLLSLFNTAYTLGTISTTSPKLKLPIVSSVDFLLNKIHTPDLSHATSNKKKLGIVSSKISTTFSPMSTTS